MPRSTHRYQLQEPSEEEKRLVGRIHGLVRRYPRYGYRFITAKLRQEGWHVNRKRIYRLWKQEGLKVPRKARKKRRLGFSGNSCVRRKAEHKDHVWTWDFIHDRTASGRPLKWFAITDEFTRECLALEVDRSITADRVLDILTNLFLIRGVPKHIRSDNGPEFIGASRTRDGLLAATRQSASKPWSTAAQPPGDGLSAATRGPGSPWENGFAESFFSRLRDELLNVEEFMNLKEARWFAKRRIVEHNEERPHSSLGYRTPSEFASQCVVSAPAPAAPPLQQPTAEPSYQPLFS